MNNMVFLGFSFLLLHDSFFIHFFDMKTQRIAQFVDFLLKFRRPAAGFIFLQTRQCFVQPLFGNFQQFRRFGTMQTKQPIDTLLMSVVLSSPKSRLAVIIHDSSAGKRLKSFKNPIPRKSRRRTRFQKTRISGRRTGPVEAHAGHIVISSGRLNGQCCCPLTFGIVHYCVLKGGSQSICSRFFFRGGCFRGFFFGGCRLLQRVFAGIVSFPDRFPIFGIRDFPSQLLKFDRGTADAALMQFDCLPNPFFNVCHNDSTPL